MKAQLQILEAISVTSKHDERKRLWFTLDTELQELIKKSKSGQYKVGFKLLKNMPTVTTTDKYPTVTEFLAMALKIESINTVAKRKDLAASFLSQYNFTVYELFIKLISGSLSINFGNSMMDNKLFSVMLADSFNEKNFKKAESSGFIVEEKFDGIRCVILKEGNEINAFTRNGKPINTISHILKELMDNTKDIHSCMFDGELIAGTTFDDTVSAVKRKEQQNNDTKFYVFDYIEGVTGEQLCESFTCNIPLLIRKQNLAAILNNTVFSLPVSYNVMNSFTEIESKGKSLLVEGKEGLVVKQLYGNYENKRSRMWLKYKAQETIDGKIVLLNEGAGKFKDTLGAVTVHLEDGTVVNVGGFTDKDRALIWSNKAEYIGRIIEIEYHMATKDSLRHPRFVRFRDNIVKGIKE